MAAPLCPREKTNFARVSRIIIDLLGGVLRDIVHACHDPVNFSLAKLMGNKNLRLNPEQKKAINNVITVGNYKNCDNSLLYTVIRNGCNTILNAPTSGWGNTVKPNDKSLTDDVERLRYYRNVVYGHVTEAKVEEVEYQSLLADIEIICERFDQYDNKTYATHAG